MDTGEVLSKNSCLPKGEMSRPMKQSMREYCVDKTTQMFKPRIGMTFDSLTEAYEFYNSCSWVMGFSIRYGDSYTSTKKVRTMQELVCQRSGKPRTLSSQLRVVAAKLVLKCALMSNQNGM
ncbi:hypothetical protein ACQ4PT_060726 [Festuca glaucescens]